MTPSTPTSSPQPQIDPQAQWNSFQQGISPDLPDEAYDSMREQFFNERVMPHVLHGGFDPHDSRENFMKATARDKSSFAGVAGSAAAESFMAPLDELLGFPGAREKMHQETQQKAQMLARQGGHEQIAQAVGGLAGTAPYWALGMGAAGAAAKALEAGPLLDAAVKTAAGGIVQGSYDAATAPQGRTLIDGLKGVGSGAAAVGAFEAAGPLWRLFRSGGMSEDMAKAVDAMAKGQREPDEQIADAILNHKEPLDQVVASHTAQSVAANKAAGVPVSSTPDPLMNGKATLQMTGADGKPYSVGPLSFDQYQYPMDQQTMETLADRVAKHLDAGGSLEGVKGDPRVIGQLLNHFVEANPERFDTDVPLKTPDGETGTITMPMKNDVARAQPATNILGLINARNSVYHATDLEGFRGILEQGEIRPSGAEGDYGPDVVDTYKDEIDKLAEARGLDPYELSYEQGQSLLKEVLQSSVSGVSVSRVPRLASKADKAITFVIDQSKMPKTRPYTEEGYEKTTDLGEEGPPDQTIISSLTPEQEAHWRSVSEHAQELRWQGVLEESNLPAQEAQSLWKQFRKDYAATHPTEERNEHFEFENRTYNEPIPLSAVRGVIVDKEALGMYPGQLPGEKMPWTGQWTPELEAYLDQIRQLAADHNIPFKTVESGAEMHSYRARLGQQPPELRWATPLYDKLREMPDGTIEDQMTGTRYANMEDAMQGIDYNEKMANTEWVRGDGVALSSRGLQEVDDLGQRFAAKGGLDELIMTNNKRSIQTGTAILAHNPTTRVGEVTDATASWGNGELVGAEHTPDVDTYKTKLAKYHPDFPIGGVDPDSGRPGESFNQVTQRILPYIKQQMESFQPGQKIGIVTHFTPIRVIDGWLKKGMPNDFSIDIPTYLRERADPGGVYRLYKSEAKAAGIVRKADYAWVDPKGKAVQVNDHDTWARKKLGWPRDEEADDMAGVSELISSRNYIRVSENTVSSGDHPTNASLDKAVEIATNSLRAKKTGGIWVAAFGKTVDIPLENVGEFLASPANYIGRYGSAFGRPGDKFAIDLSSGWKLHKVNMNNDQPLQDGIYLIRHGETLWNKGGSIGAGTPEGDLAGQTMEFKGRYRETPLSHRFIGEDIPLLGKGATAVTLGSGAGEKPTIMYSREVGPEEVFHENLHGHFNYLGIDKWLNSTFNKDSLVWDVYTNLFPPESKKLYAGRDIPEEVFNYAASAVRTGNDELLEQMGEADTDKSTVLDWTAGTSKQILSRAEETGDSLHLRTLQRRLGAVITRATGQLDDIARINSPSELDLSIERGAYVVSDPRDESRTFFDNREAALSHMEQLYAEPLNAPELVDYSSIPPTPKYAMRVAAPSGRAPITSDPPPPELMAEPYRPGMSSISFFFRPFYDWLGDVAQRFDRQDLYDRFADIDQAQVKYNNAMQPYVDTLKNTLGKATFERQADFYTWLKADEAHRPFVEQELHFTPEELGRLHDYEDNFVHKLALGDDLSLMGYMRDVQPKVEAAGWDAEKVLPKGKDDSIWGELMHSGQLDPRDNNLLRVSSIYLRKLLHNTFIEPQLEAAEDLLKEKSADGRSVWGTLTPLLQRHVNYIRGVPDFSQRVIKGAIGATIESINNGIERVNQSLPEGLQIPSIEKDPGELLNDYIMFSYAGALALRPGVWIRDASQVFITSYPLLGNYMFTGMRKAFEAAKAGTDSDAFKVAERYGAFISRSELRELMEGGGEANESTFGKVEKTVQAALSVQRWAHNSNRLVAFWGHQAKVEDALQDFARTQDEKAFTRASDAWFMRPGMRQKYLKELQLLTPDSYDDFSKRMAKDLVELTQWSYRPGARPGIYDYQLGRLFGQYGTWPLNYIEYARRFLGGMDKVAATQALTRLVLAHGAVLSAGQAVGIDTSHWTFTQPMAYGGGPLFQAVANVPNSFDFQTTRGDDARRELKELVWPGVVPGGEEAHTIWEAITTKDPNFWTRLMGFTPLSDKAKEEGWHKLVP